MISRNPSPNPNPALIHDISRRRIDGAKITLSHQTEPRCRRLCASTPPSAPSLHTANDAVSGPLFITLVPPRWMPTPAEPVVIEVIYRTPRQPHNPDPNSNPRQGALYRDNHALRLPSSPPWEGSSPARQLQRQSVALSPPPFAARDLPPCEFPVSPPRGWPGSPL